MVIHTDKCRCVFALDEKKALIPEKSVACAEHEAQGIVDTYASYEAAQLAKVEMIKAATTLSESSPSMVQTTIPTPHGTSIVLESLSQSQKDLMEILYPAAQFTRAIGLKPEYIADVALNEDKTFSASLPESDKKAKIESSIVK